MFPVSFEIVAFPPRRANIFTYVKVREAAHVSGKDADPTFGRVSTGALRSPTDGRHGVGCRHGRAIVRCSVASGARRFPRHPGRRSPDVPHAAATRSGRHRRSADFPLGSTAGRRRGAGPVPRAPRPHPRPGERHRRGWSLLLAPSGRAVSPDLRQRRPDDRRSRRVHPGQRSRRADQGRRRHSATGIITITGLQYSVIVRTKSRSSIGRYHNKLRIERRFS